MEQQIEMEEAVIGESTMPTVVESAKNATKRTLSWRAALQCMAVMLLVVGGVFIIEDNRAIRSELNSLRQQQATTHTPVKYGEATVVVKCTCD